MAVELKFKFSSSDGFYLMVISLIVIMHTFLLPNIYTFKHRCFYENFVGG